jgi:hypothetical protein
LGDVIDNDGTVGISIVHRSQRLIALLAGSIPDFKLDCGTLIEGDGLCQESGSDRRLAVIIELVLIRRLASEGSMYPWITAGGDQAIIEVSL